MGAKIFEHCDRFFSSGYVSGPENAWHECSPVVNVWDLTCTFTVVLSFVRSWSVTQSSFGPLSPSPAPPPPPPKLGEIVGKYPPVFVPLDWIWKTIWDTAVLACSMIFVFSFAFVLLSHFVAWNVGQHPSLASDLGYLGDLTSWARTFMSDIKEMLRPAWTS